jgi:hypothetical protein
VKTGKIIIVAMIRVYIMHFGATLSR